MPENITSVLIIYTGGTIGMVENSKTGSLEPFNFHHLLDKVPELRQLGFSISTVQFEPPIDSSEIEPDSWVKLVHIIADNYDLFEDLSSCTEPTRWHTQHRLSVSCSKI